MMNAVHKETDAGRSNPDYKGMSIEIRDGEGIRITSSKDISITSQGNVTVSSEGASLVVAGTDSVDIRQGGAGIHMDDDVTFKGGKFRVQ